jgi:hypothetical protein
MEAGTTPQALTKFPLHYMAYYCFVILLRLPNLRPEYNANDGLVHRR